MKAQDFFDKYYSVENQAVLDLIKKVNYGTLVLKIHAKKVTEATPSYNLRFNNNANIESSNKAIELIGKDNNEFKED